MCYLSTWCCLSNEVVLLCLSLSSKVFFFHCLNFGPARNPIMLHVVGQKLLSCFQQKEEGGNICMLIIVEKYFTSVQSIEQKKTLRRIFSMWTSGIHFVIILTAYSGVTYSASCGNYFYTIHPRQLRCESFSFFNYTWRVLIYFECWNISESHSFIAPRHGWRWEKMRNGKISSRPIARRKYFKDYFPPTWAEF